MSSAAAREEEREWRGGQRRYGGGRSWVTTWMWNTISRKGDFIRSTNRSTYLVDLIGHLLTYQPTYLVDLIGSYFVHGKQELTFTFMIHIMHQDGHGHSKRILQAL